jgi:lipoprotein NlpD
MCPLYWLILVAFLASCESNPPVKVIDRTPETKPKPPITKPIDKSTADTRPDSYTVKKGDNLLRVGLENGFDYKEIALANNIPPPYVIRVGQKLDFTTLKSKTSAADGVVVTPVKTDPNTTEVKPIETIKAPPKLSQPKATREEYSLEAMRQTGTKTAEAAPIKSTDTKPTETGNDVTGAPDAAKPAGDEINWSWPTQGKVIASFSEGVNKGIDIGGGNGQAIKAAASGKVIYSGSDLRGYGKLVIIKHNKTYLSVYAHNSKILVKEGQIVAVGQKIAEMGNTDSPNTKLHFEIRRQGKSVDPAKYLAPN